jgi:hypothetical protein
LGMLMAGVCGTTQRVSASLPGLELIAVFCNRCRCARTAA